MSNHDPVSFFEAAAWHKNALTGTLQTEAARTLVFVVTPEAFPGDLGRFAEQENALTGTLQTEAARTLVFVVTP